jgi:hypothetical protein
MLPPSPLEGRRKRADRTQLSAHNAKADQKTASLTLTVLVCEFAVNTKS